ncbi:MAG: 5-deoxy-glucuronate isomerase, partial [Thermodesulfobacteriota bacterium]
METTMRKYALQIERNEINPHLQYDGKKSGLILDPRREEVPLEVIGFGIYQLGENFIEKETKEKEVVMIPQEGEFEAEVNGKRFFGERKGGPFASRPGQSSASALYFPCNSRFKIRGRGEMVFFEAPALKENSPFYLPSGQAKPISRGSWIWRRDVTSLISPKDVSSNLVVGETYNPPGFWSGTPPHQHDKDLPSQGESGHEEVYYYRFNLKRRSKDRFGPYGVQLLMDGERLMKAFLIGEKSIFAIPGGCHPVVASPVSELLYVWGLAGKGSELGMKDIDQFSFLKSFEEIFTGLEKQEKKKILLKKRLHT